MTPRKQGLLLALVTACLSGISLYVNTFGVRAVGDPTAYTTAKNTIAALLLLLLVSTVRRTAIPRPRGREWIGLGLVGVIGGSIPFVLFFEGLARASAPQAAFLHKTLVVWVAVLAVIVLRERVTLAHVGAIGLLLAGQWLLADSDGFPMDTGALLILAATLLWSAETILAKRLLAGFPSLGLGAVRMGLGSLVLLGWLVASGRLGVLRAMTPGMWGWALLTGVLLAGYVTCWYAALARAQAVDVTAVLVLGAVVTTLIADGFRVPVADLSAAIMIASGAGLVAWTMLRPVRAVEPVRPSP